MTHGGGSGPRVIEGRARRALNNRLDMEFRGDDGALLAQAQQDFAGTGRKLGVLLGFRNGGPGTHVLTIGAQTVGVVSRDAAPTDITDGVGGPLIATIDRGDTSQAVDAVGRPLLRFAERAPEEQTHQQYSVDVLTPDGRPIGRLDVLRVWTDWTVGKALEAAATFSVMWDRAGQSLKLPLVGVRLELPTPVDDRTLQILLGASVDIVIGLRPYTVSMR